MTIGKVMEVIGIPHDDFSPNYLCNELHGCVAIPKYPQIFENAEGSTWRCAYESKCNGLILTAMT